MPFTEINIIFLNIYYMICFEPQPITAQSDNIPVPISLRRTMLTNVGLAVLFKLLYMKSDPMDIK